MKNQEAKKKMSKKMTRRDMLKLSGMLAAGSFLAACGAGRAEDEYVVDLAKLEAASGNVVVMHFLHEFTEDHVQAFQAENPNITIELADAADATRFFAMLAAGTPPDLYRTMAPDIPQFLARELILNLQGFFDVSELIAMDDLAPANDNYKANSPTEVGRGPLYGMVKDFSPDQSLFINQKLFEEAGIPIPGDEDADRLSYDQVAEFAGKMTKFDGDRLVSYGYGPEYGWIGRMIQNMIIENNVELYSPDFERVILKESPDATEAVRFYHDLAANKYSHSTISPSPNGWMGTDFTAGILGIIQYGFWFSAMADTETSFVKMLPAASWAGESRNPCTTATGMVMIKATQNAEAAWKVFEYYNAGQPSIDRAMSGWGVPALKSQFGLIPQITDFQKQAYKVVMNEIALNDPPLQFNPYLNNNSWNAVWGPNFDLVLTGAIDFDGFLTNLENEINQLIAEGKETVEAAVG